MNEHQEEGKVIVSPEFPTMKLMDNEQQELASHRAKISKIALALEDMLLAEDCTMGDLAEIMDLYNFRAHKVFSLTKIKDLKQTYGTN